MLRVCRTAAGSLGMRAGDFHVFTVCLVCLVFAILTRALALVDFCIILPGLLPCRLTWNPQTTGL